MSNGVGYYPKGDTCQRGPTHIVMNGHPICGARPKGEFHYCSFIIGGYEPECRRCASMVDCFNVPKRRPKKAK